MHLFQWSCSVPDCLVGRLTLLALLLVSERHFGLVLSHDQAGAGTCSSSWPPFCSQLCSGGGSSSVDVRCSCETGFYLAADGRHCHANQSTSSFQPRGRSAFLLYNSGVDIMAVAFDSRLSTSASSSSSSSTSSSSIPTNSIPTIVYKGTPQIDVSNFAMALEISKGRVFFGNGEEPVIRSLEIELKTSTDFVVNGLSVVSSLAFDWVTSVLYVSDIGLHKIFACSTSTGQCSDIITVHLSVSMDIDAINGRLYWSECSLSGRVEWSHLDGSNRQTVKPDDSCPQSLKVDRPTQTLYWVNAADDQIHMYDLTTGKLRLLPPNDYIYLLSCVAVFEDDVIWTTSMTNDYAEDGGQKQTTIHNADKFNRSEILQQPKIIVENIPNVPLSLQVWHSALQVPGANPCAEKQCSHLCLQSKAPGGATCACPSGMVLANDQHNCTIDWSLPFVVFVKRNELLFVGVDFVGGKAGETFFRVRPTETIDALAFDQSAMTIYLSVGNASVDGSADDRHRRAQATIMRIDLNRKPFTSERLFSTASTVPDLEVDWLSKNIYWVNYDAGFIEVANMEDLSQAVLSGDGGSGVTEKPRAIAVDSMEKRLFYSDCGRNPHLGSCDLAGRRCKTMALKKGECVTDMIVDHANRKIYFVLGSRIMAINLDLTRLVLHRNGRRPNSLATLVNSLYWTDELLSDIKVSVDSSDVDDERIRVGEDGTGLGPIVIFSESAQPQGLQKSHLRIQKKEASTNAMAQMQQPTRPFSVATPYASSGAPSFRGMLSYIALPAVAATFVPCPCRNGGSCEIGSGFVKCLCPSGFSGGFCEQRDESSAQSSSSYWFDRDFLIYVGSALGALVIVIATLVAVMCVVKQRNRFSARSHSDDVVQIKSSENSAYEMSCMDDSKSASSGQKKVAKQ